MNERGIRMDWNELGKLLLVFAVIAIWPMYLLIKAECRRMKNNRAPEILVRAEVIAKSITSDNVQYSSWYLTDRVFYATFLLDDGETVELAMSDRKWGALHEGDEGQLLYQGVKMLEFSRDVKSE